MAHKIDWRKDLQDDMWSMYRPRENQTPEDAEADKEALKENCVKLM